MTEDGPKKSIGEIIRLKRSKSLDTTSLTGSSNYRVCPLGLLLLPTRCRLSTTTTTNWDVHAFESLRQGLIQGHIFLRTNSLAANYSSHLYKPVLYVPLLQFSYCLDVKVFVVEAPGTSVVTEKNSRIQRVWFESISRRRATLSVSTVALDRKTAKLTDRPDSARSEHLDHPKLLDRRIDPDWLPPPSILTSSPLPLEDPAPSSEQGVEWRRMGHGTDVHENEPLRTANELKFVTTEHNRAKPSGQSVTTPPGLSVPPSMLAPPPLPPEFEEPAPSLERGGEPRRRILNQGSGSKTGEEVGITWGREERTRSVHDSHTQTSWRYDRERRSTTPAVPLSREQSYERNVSRTVNHPVLHHELSPILAMQQPDEPKPDEQRKLNMCTFANQESATSEGLSGVYQHQYLHARVELVQDEDEEQVPYLVPPNTSTHQGRTPRLPACPPERLVANLTPFPPINYASRPLR
ncbi:hypothetical protein K435DRAFT_809032 [Dendrothele bispora CBS 962.96]|uniref:Uncharacterized protein n=1 Tax=Dendrothele bispora (strain CBS 962.96) TaxID=1314807 RepID=A0A4S8KZG8_DENBC|nr:hypothetical protein K435DRAFT_809032 [Dendrothele bispora CBS 962.96]